VLPNDSIKDAMAGMEEPAKSRMVLVDE